MDLKEKRAFEFTVINPNKPIFIFPHMFTVMLGIAIFAAFLGIIGYSFTNPSKTIILPQFHIKFFNIDATGFVILLGLSAIVFAPMLLGSTFFSRKLLKHYLSKAKVRFENNILYIDYFNDIERYCSSHIIDLNEIESYGISKSITLMSATRGLRNLEKMGICVVVNGKKIILKLYDYRTLPFESFKDIKGLYKFSDYLCSLINTFNENNEKQIRYRVPISWQCYNNPLFIVFIFFGAFIFLTIFLSTYIRFIT